MYADGLTETSTVTPSGSTDNATRQNSRAETARVSRPPVALLGVAFDNLTLRETVERIEKMIASRRPHHVVTANVDFLAQARGDMELHRILLDAHLVLCDGTPLVWASRLFGNSLSERVAGADVVPELIRLAAKNNHRLFFLGATEAANTQAIAKLRQQFPALAISHYSPPFRSLLEMNDAEIIRRIRDAKPDLLLVAFGCPKAEKWLAMHYRELGVPVVMGVGATIDFLAGQIKRAPLWMQRGGVEWIYRLRQEPQRLIRRYATDLNYFCGAMLRQWWTMQSQTVSNGIQDRTSVIQSENTWQWVKAGSRLNKDSVESDAISWQEMADANRDCLLELSRTNSIDSTGAAFLVHLKKQLRRSGRQLILLSPSVAVRRVLRVMQLEGYFEVASNAFEARAVIEARTNERFACLGRNSNRPPGLRGEITATNAEQVAECTKAAIDRSNSTTESCIDLAAVRFVDSGGVKLLLHAVEIARAHGVHLRFSDPCSSVRNVLRVSNLDHLLEQSK